MALLAKELTNVSIGLLSGSTKDVPGWGQDAPMLVSIVAHLEPSYPIQPLGALKRVLRRAIEVDGDGPMKHGTVAFAYAAERLFGFATVDQGVVADKDKAYDKVLEAVCREAGITEEMTGTRRRYSRHVRERIAHALVALAAEEPHGALAREAHIERIDLIRDIMRLLGPGKPPLLLWGESGNGKTDLALEVARRYSPRGRFVVLRGPSGPNPPFLDGDIEQALKLTSRPMRPPGRASYQAIRELLREPGALDLLILDDVDEGMVQPLLGSDVRVPVLMTSRTFQSWEGVKAEPKRIDAFSDRQAMDYLAARLPDEDTNELGELAGLLGNRPLGLDLVVREVQETETTFQQALANCRRDAADTLEGAIRFLGEPVSRALVGVYERLVSALDEGGIALGLLDTLIWLTGPAPLDRVLDLYRCREDEWSAGESRRYRRGLHELSTLGLLHIDSQSKVQVNDLTRAILERVRAEALEQFLARFADRTITPSVACASGKTLPVLGQRPLDLDLRELAEVPRRDSFTSWIFLTEMVAVVAVLLRLAGAEDGPGALRVNRNRAIVWGLESSNATTDAVAPELALIECRDWLKDRIWIHDSGNAEWRPATRSEGSQLEVLYDISCRLETDSIARWDGGTLSPELSRSTDGASRPRPRGR